MTDIKNIDDIVLIANAIKDGKELLAKFKGNEVLEDATFRFGMMRGLTLNNQLILKDLTQEIVESVERKIHLYEAILAKYVKVETDLLGEI